MRRPLSSTAAVFLVFTGSLLPSCTTIESNDLDTDAIQARIDVAVRRDGSASDVKVQLTAGTLTSVDLDGDDRLVATAGDTAVTLQETELAGAVEYKGTLPGIAAVDTPVTVALERTLFAAAPESTVTLPLAPSLASPAAGAAFSRANDDIVVTLAEASPTDGVHLSWSGACVIAGELDVPANQAQVTLAKGTIVKREPSAPETSLDVPDSCVLTISASRVRQGVLDSGYEGGQIRAFAMDSRDLTTNP